MSELGNLSRNVGEAEARRYTQALLGALGDRDPFEVLEATAGELARVLQGQDSATLRRADSAGGWSILEVAAHLADSELAWSWRLRTVLADERPVLSGYDQDRWAERFAYRDADPATVLEQFQLLRKLNIGLLRGLSDEDRRRVGLHAERGEESVQHMIHLYAGHDLVHLRQIARVAASSRG